jgi:hypothetical protein
MFTSLYYTRTRYTRTTCIIILLPSLLFLLLRVIFCWPTTDNTRDTMDMDGSSCKSATAQAARCIHNPQDVSNILFRNPTCSMESNRRGGRKRGARIEPFVGPIQVVLAEQAEENKDNEQQKQRQPVVVHGRGVVATRNIQAGELLFATSPGIQANVEHVKELWKRRCLHSRATTTTMEHRNLVEHCTEEVLVQAMLQAATDVVASFMCLVGAGIGEDSAASSLDLPTLDVLLNTVQNGSFVNELHTTPPTRDELLRVIRHNAFGPDGLQSYDHVERIWRSEHCQEEEEEGEDSCKAAVQQQQHDDYYLPPRLLGIYPLAAMLNHSCVANAVRVYADGDVMLVHASSDIAQGQEIVWSYLPPTWPYEQRVQILKNLHGFVCQCTRCLAEYNAYHSNDTASGGNLWSRLQTIDDLNLPCATSRRQNQDEQRQQLSSAIATLENDILREPSLSNEMRRYLRVGYAQVYMRHFNAELASLANDTANANIAKRREELLMLGMQLHFSFCAGHNASTEHLSVCALCAKRN